MKSKLPPLDFSEDVKEYEAHHEQKEVKFVKCDHRNAKIVNHELRCPCGAAWTGPGLEDLYRKLTKQ